MTRIKIYFIKIAHINRSWKTDRRKTVNDHCSCNNSIHNYLYLNCSNLYLSYLVHTGTVISSPGQRRVKLNAVPDSAE